MKKIIDLYKSLGENESLLPTSTNFEWWDSVYGANTAVYDREFARKYSIFDYYDFLEDEDYSIESAKANLKSDVLAVLTFNQKKYAEMYRVFVVTDLDDPITYNYDMTETTGAQHSETKFGARQSTKGQQIDTHSVAPMNSTTPQVESSDTDGQRIDSELSHTDEMDSNAWTLTRKGNIGVQTAGDIMRIHTDFWTNRFKFMDMIFDDINAQLLLIGD